MEITLGLQPVLLLTAAVAAAAAAYLSYRNTTPRLSPAKRTVLGGLRFLSLAVIIFLLAEPLLARLSALREEPVLAVLIDSSESMAMENAESGQAPALQNVRSILEKIRAMPAPAVRYLTFDSRVTDLGSGQVQVDSVAFSGQRTDIAGAIEETRDLLSNDHLAGILLISDGRYTSGRNPRRVAESTDIPIFTIAVGDSTQRQDVRISRMTTNDITYTGLEVPVEIGVAATGFQDRRVTVTLSLDDSVTASANTVLPADGAEGTIELSYAAATPGLKKISARVTGLEGETTYRNNVAARTVRVLDRKRRILLVAAGPDPDLAAIRRILADHGDAEVTTRVQQGSRGYYEGALPGDLGSFDVLMLAGYPASSAPPGDLARIASAIENGLPAVFLLSRQTDTALFRRDLAPSFGITPGNRRVSFYEATIVPTPAGRRHPILQHASGGGDWVALPPVVTSESPWSASPDVRVLATPLVRGVRLDDPLLVARSRGRNRTATFLGAGTWRLGNLPEDLSSLKGHWPGLLTNMIQWVSAAEDNRAVRVNTTASEFAGGDAVGFTGQVYDESLNPVADADVAVTVTAPSGDEYRYTMDPIGNGRYVLDAGPMEAGTHRFRASAVRAGAELGSDSGSFRVGDLALEFRNPVADPLLLRQIAVRSGGAALTSDTVEQLGSALETSERFQPRITTSRTESELWRHPAFLLFVIVSLAAEWVLRKRMGLS